MSMNYESYKDYCCTCQFWEGDRKVRPFIVEVQNNLGKCVVDWKIGPTKSAQTPPCAKYKKWDQIK